MLSETKFTFISWFICCFIVIRDAQNEGAIPYSDVIGPLLFLIIVPSVATFMISIMTSRDGFSYIFNTGMIALISIGAYVN